jgi:hypothetical protein
MGVFGLRSPLHSPFASYPTGRPARHTLPRKFAKSEEEKFFCPFRKALVNLPRQGHLEAADKRETVSAAAARVVPAEQNSSRSWCAARSRFWARS